MPGWPGIDAVKEHVFADKDACDSPSIAVAIAYDFIREAMCAENLALLEKGQAQGDVLRNRRERHTAFCSRSDYVAGELDALREMGIDPNLGDVGNK